MEWTSLIVVVIIGLSSVFAVMAVISLSPTAAGRPGEAQHPAVDDEMRTADAEAEDLAQLLAVTNERRLARGLPARTAGDVQRELLEESRR